MTKVKMSLLEERTSFLERQADRFDNAVSGMLYAINSFGPETTVLARKFFEARSGTLHSLFGGPSSLYAKKDPTVLTYGPIYELVQFLETIAHFISHEIHDDGSPAIVYYREDSELQTFDPETRTWKKTAFLLGHTPKNEKLSIPYLHCSTDFLWENSIPFEVADVTSLIILLDEMEEEAKAGDERVKTLRRIQNRPEDEPETPPYAHLISDFFDSSFSQNKRKPELVS